MNVVIFFSSFSKGSSKVMHSRASLAFLDTKALKSFSEELFSSSSAPRMHAVIPPQVQYSMLALFEDHKVIFCPTLKHIQGVILNQPTHTSCYVSNHVWQLPA